MAPEVASVTSPAGEGKAVTECPATPAGLDAVGSLPISTQIIEAEPA